MLGLMYPDNADRYRAKEQYWRSLEDAARRRGVGQARDGALREGALENG